MACVPTAATDNDIIYSFPGWTRPVSGRACARRLQHTDPERMLHLPNYSQTSCDSDRRHGALTRQPFLVSSLFE